MYTGPLVVKPSGIDGISISEDFIEKRIVISP
jgi:hypothetical protein